jgi:oligoribonuclease (3'-5' exoribonuclease)
MTARIAIAGRGTEAQLRHALSRYRQGAVVVAGEETVVPAGVAAVSRYRAVDGDVEGRDVEMLSSGVNGLVVFAGGEATATTARRLGVPVTGEDMEKQHQFLWLDLETTGLVPSEGLLLEFAVVLCEDGPGDDFATAQQYTGVIHHDRNALSTVEIDAYVRRMHTENRLWIDVAESTTTLEEVDGFLAGLAGTLTPRKHSIVLAGNSVHFDLRWCSCHLPAFAEHLSHRVFDVSTLRRAVQSWCPNVPPWPTFGAHRALPDLLTCIEEARAAKKAMGWA